MENKDLLNRNPLLRLVLPFVLGIAAGHCCGVGLLYIILLLALSVPAVVLGFFRFAPRWLFGLGAVALMFASGVFVEHSQSERMTPQWSAAKQVYKACLLETPALRGTNVKVLASVALAGDAEKGTRSNGKVYLYFQRSVDSESLELGDSLSFEAAVELPKNAGNPAEFDFEKYCYVKGVTGSVYLYDGTWQKSGTAPQTLSMRALRLREKVVDRYDSLGLEGDALALVSALTVGEKRDLTQELKESYSSAGASHLLALSGLHLGIIYAILSFVLPQRRRNRAATFLREGVVLLFLWGFAFMAGLTPSVVRAAILFSLVSFGRCIGQESSSVSSLAFAAMAMLVVSPHSLFDIGFQLSFSAVFSILLLARPLQKLFRVERHGVLYGYVANLLILAFVAQVGTFPFVWYHFGEFPVYSFFANLFVVPLAFVVITIAIVTLALSFVPFLQQPLVWLLGVVADTMNGIVEFTAGLPGASLSLPPAGVVGVLVVSLLSVALAVGLFRRRWWLVAFAVASATMLLPFGGNFLKRRFCKEDCLIIYNNRKNPLIHAVQKGGKNWLVSTVPQLDAEYDYASSPYIKREGLPEPEWAYWNFPAEGFSVEEGLVDFCGMKVRLVDNGYWNESLYSVPADAVVLCRGFLGSVEELLEVYPTGCLVLDASLYGRSRERILRECALLGVDAVDISRTGAVALIPGDDSFTLEPLRGK